MHTLSARHDLKPVVDETFSVHPFADASFSQKINHSLLEYTCTDSTEHVRRILALKNNVTDTCLVQELAEQKP
ncbi:hypothetical protein D3C84_954090 [compost metagenome]